MYDDELDALAAEYVLGTLSADERSNAEAVLRIDAGFAEIVRKWERRLGELNVMVESVEPPAEVWDKIKSELSTVAGSDELRLTPGEPTPPRTETETKTESDPEIRLEGRHFSPVSALVSRLSASEEASGAKPEVQPNVNLEAPSGPESAAAPSSPIVSEIEGGAKMFDLARRLRRWRRAALVAGTVAVLLGIFIGLSHVAPGRAPASALGRQMVAVLQQGPTSPAFLLTVDPASRTMTVRTISARQEAGHSYELWLLSPRLSKPRSLGVVGVHEFTQRSIPRGVDFGTIKAATYEISFEPTGGSKLDEPTGPILFTGTLADALPASPPQ